LICITAGAWWFFRKFAFVEPILYWVSLGIKLSAGLFIGWLYTYYYPTSDTFHYFNDSILLADLARSDFVEYIDLVFNGSIERYTTLGMINLEARSVFFVKILSIPSFITWNNYWISSLHLSLISFFSTYYLFKTISRHFPTLQPAAMFALLLFPSCVLWSSGITKESLGMASLYFISSIVIQVWRREHNLLFQLPLTLLMAFVLWEIRYFYAGLFFPPIIAAIIVRYISERSKLPRILEFILFLAILVLGGILVTFLHPNFSCNKFLNVLVNNNIEFMRLSSAEDVIHYYQLKATWLSVLINSPEAFFSGLFRPFVWEASNVWQIAASIENLVILIMTAFSISKIRSVLQSPDRHLLIAVLAYIVLLCVFLSISTPNFGSLARYRIGLLPFYLILVLDHPILNRLHNKMATRFSISLFR
jgi:hypothetical protein